MKNPFEMEYFPFDSSMMELEWISETCSRMGIETIMGFYICHIEIKRNICRAKKKMDVSTFFVQSDEAFDIICLKGFYSFHSIF